jgi:hypothetical protein
MVPALAWLLLCLASLAGIVLTRPQAADSVAAPLVATAPLPELAAPVEDSAADVAAPTFAVRAPTRPALLPDLDPSTPSSALPRAGRQVLRCVEQGRTVYRDLNSGCAEGGGALVTLFPTQGVELPR